MRVVPDTNVYVSATLSDGSPSRVLELAEAGEIDIYISPFIFREVEDVLMRDKIPFGEDRVEKFVDKVLSMSSVVSPNYTPEVIDDDPSDNHILACALESEAEYVVSGDRHLLEVEEYEGISIVEPAEFIGIVEWFTYTHC
ncbi:MAG: putative toxin-antitoxin system toxin component, PIN family, partial [Halobacteria archaeon]|nr:putative toxin-antitoxin system toxin component, PIN family [Halobacteria archaeon]